MATTTTQDRARKHLRYGDSIWARRHRVLLREQLGSFATPSPELAAVLRRCALPRTVTALIDAHAPRLPKAVWDRIGPFVRDAVSLAAPKTAYSAEILMTATTHYVAWCMAQGWTLDAEVVWSRQAIDLYVTNRKLPLADGTRRNYRARLMRISEVLLPEEHGEQMSALNRKSTAAPYTAAQMEAHRQWAGAQVTPVKRYRAMLMLVFCAGAGLRPSEIALVRATDVSALEVGYLISVEGDNAREVPLLGDWDEWMEVLLEGAPSEGPLWGKPNRTRGNAILSSFTQYTVGEAPRGDRLRATWFVRHLSAGVPTKELFRAGGFEKFEHLPRLLHYVPDAPPEAYISALRGSAVR